MLIKVCGLREHSNVADIARLKPDLMGFIFYPGSKRYVGDHFDGTVLPAPDTGIRTVAVFVNGPVHKVCSVVLKYGFDVVQLHGDEPPDYCLKVRETGVSVWKSFGIGTAFDWQVPDVYADACDYFLFDTSTQNYGGSGQKFNWEVLKCRRFTLPFLLSGGIGPEDVSNILSFDHPDFAGIDINSRFETVPGHKDVDLTGRFISGLRK